MRPAAQLRDPPAANCDVGEQCTQNHLANRGRSQGSRAGTLFLWTFFWKVYTAIFVGLIAVLLAMVLHAPAKYFSRWVPFRVSFAITVLLFLASLVGLGLALIPQIVDQVSQLAGQLPTAMDTVREWLEERTGASGDGELTGQINR